MERSILRSFIKYVSANILGMIGLSCYILADTFFIAEALGPTGIAALNFSISVYSIIHGIGLMLGIGGATRYSILTSRREQLKANGVFTTSLLSGVIVGVILAAIGLLGSQPLAQILGADQDTLHLTKTYLTTILGFAPFFILNNIVLAFVRNDHNPRLAMIAMLAGSFSNIVLDYVFMFPLNMGMFGAAFATGLAPVISLGILSIHFMDNDSPLRPVLTKIRWASVQDILRLGLSPLIIEVSSAVVLISFNLVIFRLKGNSGVAAYGIVANIALVGIAIFTGIAQGAQPLVSISHGLKKDTDLRRVQRYALRTSLGIALVLISVMLLFSDPIVGIFNSRNHQDIALMAKEGLHIYFLGFLFAGINIIHAMVFSTTEHVKSAFIISMARGCMIIVPMVLMLSSIWGMTGVWLSFVVTELIVTMMALCLKKTEVYSDALELELENKRL